MPLLVSRPLFLDYSKTHNALKTLVSHISNSCYQKHLIVLQKLVFIIIIIIIIIFYCPTTVISTNITNYTGNQSHVYNSVGRFFTTGSAKNQSSLGRSCVVYFANWLAHLSQPVETIVFKMLQN